MKRVPNTAGTTVAVRGVLAFLFATVTLLCLFGRGAEARPGSPDTPPQRPAASAQGVSAPTATRQIAWPHAAPAESSPASDGTAPCGKKLIVGEPGGQRGDVPQQTAALTGNARSGDRPALPTAGTTPYSAGPTPPPPLAITSVLRI
ncbi:hypothetical protein [Streptomyces sp. NPDC088789]|uniref:hypothetical protein n=1 Tax=Streptomyces sp. NPDC088789 TaxID=3365899 RepID=UPI0037FC1058